MTAHQKNSCECNNNDQKGTVTVHELVMLVRAESRVPSVKSQMRFLLTSSKVLTKAEKYGFPVSRPPDNAHIYDKQLALASMFKVPTFYTFSEVAARHFLVGMRAVRSFSVRVMLFHVMKKFKVTRREKCQNL